MLFYIILFYLRKEVIIRVLNYLPPTQLRYGIKGGGFAKALSLGSKGKPGNLCPRVKA
jgi:hypothetical protein